MTNAESRTPPTLATWAEVDPARYPFDPAEVPALARRLTPVPPPPPGRDDISGIEGSAAWAWVEAVSTVLADRYGPWAYDWYSAPGTCWIIERIPAPSEAPALVAESLLTRRRWLETVAERFDRFLPLLDPAQAAEPGDIVAAWEAAFAELIRAAAAPLDDYDGWQGWCTETIQWFLTAYGMPVKHAEALANSAFPRRFCDDDRLTVAQVNDVAERLTRDVLDPGRVSPAAPTDVWPDTWPQHWPAWRATNTTGHGWR
ncbi:hypothetical protein [Actinoplanes sp. NPDC049118]|uniref:hypothetical protein n=1 Tax=Actinoplanes sp. NPDC049118 TaxID=3155769 RepID=UPI0033E25D02